MERKYLGLLVAAIAAIVAHIVVAPLVGVTEGMSLAPTWMWLGAAVVGVVIYMLADVVGSALAAVVFMVVALVARGMHQPDWSTWLWVVGFAALGAVVANLFVSKAPRMVGGH